MVKFKRKKSFFKRFIFNSCNKIKRLHCCKNHNLTKKTNNNKRRLKKNNFFSKNKWSIFSKIIF